MYMTQGLHRAVQQNPQGVAVRFAGRQRTFADFAQRVARLAGALRALGMQDDDRVAMLALNSDRYLEYQMAVPWGGGVINPCNIRWSPAEILYSLEDSGSTILLVDDAFSGMVGQLRGGTSPLREIVYCGDGAVPAGMHGYERILEAAEPIADRFRQGDDLAGVFYTGGTTGFPKGVMLSHTNLCSSALAMAAAGVMPTGATYLHAAPMFHVADFGAGMGNWAMGNTHSIVPMFRPDLVLDTIERDRVTFTMLVPTMIQMMVDHPSMKQPRDLSSLKTLSYGAAPISEGVVERALAALPGVELVQAYGMTEMSPLITINPAWTHTPEGRKAGKMRAAGRACVCVELRIVGPDGEELPRGSVGEVVLRGPNVMRGYWNKPEQTAEALRDGWLHTGDAAWMDEDGFVYIADRLKDMIISGGENVYSAEVENALGRHPAVAACAVIGIPSDQWGESVHAVVVRKTGVELEASDLIAHCKTLIAGYKCPRSIEFVEALPLSGAGKVLKGKLREPFWSGRDRAVA